MLLVLYILSKKLTTNSTCSFLTTTSSPFVVENTQHAHAIDNLAILIRWSAASTSGTLEVYFLPICVASFNIAATASSSNLICSGLRLHAHSTLILQWSDVYI